MSDRNESSFALHLTYWVVIAVVAFIAYSVGHSVSPSAAVNSAKSNQPETLAPALGNPKATLTVKEYADYQCPYCAKFNEQMMPQLKQDFIDTGKVKFEFINAPLLGKESVYSAAAAYCANDQKQYWAYHNELYRITAQKNGDESHPILNQGIFSTANLEHAAAVIGLNTSQFNQCVSSGQYVSTVVNEQTAATKLGITGTPYFVIGNQSFSGLQPYSIVKSLIESQL